MLLVCIPIIKQYNADEWVVADPSLSRSQTEHEDVAFQQAMAASRVDAGLPPQESGVMNTDQVHFGPANRGQYDQSQWAMVPIGKSSAQEILLDPEPEERKRDLDAPAFLKPSIEDHRLGALLTIYHEIPIAREIFLERGRVLSEYGHDKEWWTGKPIQTSTISTMDDEDEASEADQFGDELQRLMAFLDKTDRSYGSVDVLTSFPTMKRLHERGRDGSKLDMESAFFETWREIWENTKEEEELFSRGVPSEKAGKEEGMDFAMLKLDLPEESSPLETIYDLADQMLWNLLPLELETSPYLSRIGEVIAFQLDGTESSKNIAIPAVWYPDRYLKSGREAALQMRQHQADIQEDLDRMALLENKLTYYHTPGGKTLKVQDMFKTSIQHDIAKLNDGDLTLDSELENLENADMISQPSSYDLSGELSKVLESIDKKLLGM